MPKIAIELPYEKIVEVVSKLSEEDKEHLFFTINEDYAKALSKMRKEAWKTHERGKRIRLRDLK